MKGTDRQYHALLAEIDSLLRELTKHSPEALARTGEAPAFDGYPRSSLPESSIASGRLGNPTLSTVVAHAGGDDEGSPDTWRPPEDPIGLAVERMVRNARDSLAALLDAAGEKDVSADLDFELVLLDLGNAIYLLGDVPSPDARVQRLTLRGRDRLRTSASEMRKAIPRTIPDPPREQCVDCGISKSLATNFGHRPQGWLVSEARCDACSRRHRRHAGR